VNFSYNAKSNYWYYFSSFYTILAFDVHSSGLILESRFSRIIIQCFLLQIPFVWLSTNYCEALTGKDNFENLNTFVDSIMMGFKETGRCGHRLTSFETGLVKSCFERGTEQSGTWALNCSTSRKYEY
jgi:hypothetical protein